MAINVFGNKEESTAVARQEDFPHPLALQAGAGERDRRYEVLIPRLDQMSNEHIVLTDENPAVRVPAEVLQTRQMLVHGNNRGGVDAYLHEDVMRNTTFALPAWNPNPQVEYRGAPSPDHITFVTSDKRTGLPFVVKVDTSRLYLTRRFVLASQNADLTVKFPAVDRSVSMEAKYGRYVLLITSIGDEVEIRREAIFTTNLLEAFSMQVSIATQKIPSAYTG